MSTRRRDGRLSETRGANEKGDKGDSNALMFARVPINVTLRFFIVLLVVISSCCGFDGVLMDVI